MIGKYILPWFGSSPAVWSASLLFFQAVLALGYAYAYALSGRFSIRDQAKIHLSLLGLCILVLILTAMNWPAPVLPDDSFQPQDWSNPFWSVMKILLISVGLPFFLLATNSTLLQAWFGNIYANRSPYRLYALSNLASLLGLLSYPFVVELYLKIIDQGRWWTFLFLIFIISVSVIAWRLLRMGDTHINHEKVPNPVLEKPKERSEKPRFWQLSLWFLLPAIASVLLLATTNQITQEIAVIPFLWVLPLALYLISFILCFEGDHWYGRSRFTFVLALATAAYWLMVEQGPVIAIEIQIAVYCLLLFITCMICHGELAQLRPTTRHLTTFYLLVALGGAAGGIFVNLIAPLLFKQYRELALGLILCVIILIGLTLWVKREGSRWRLSLMALSQFTILVGIILITFNDYRATLRGTLWMDRNFFGVLRVKERTYDPGDTAYQLVHGITIHGIQFVDPEKRNTTTSYYTETSGVGLAYNNLIPNRPVKVGILGLGVGTIAAYGKEGDLIQFYEINPAVIELARGEGGFFSFLEDSDVEVEIVLGDARLSLEREMRTVGSQAYDLMVLDTFNSDSIPIHLITYEAFDLYLEHLKEDGVLAVHISNIHLDLEPVVKEIASAHRLYSVVLSSGRSRPGSSASVWVLLTRNEEFLQQENLQDFISTNTSTERKIQLWTDDYSNLYQIVR